MKRRLTSNLVSRVSIQLLSVENNPNIGVFALTSENMTILPKYFLEKDVKIVEKTLKSTIIRIDAPLGIIGILGVMNSEGVVLSPILDSNMYQLLEDALEIPIVQTKYFHALGNTVLVNDYGGICSPTLDENTVKTLKSVLKVPMLKCKIAGSDLVGSLCVANNHGAMVTPVASSDDLRLIKTHLGLENVGTGTVNMGQDSVSAGILTTTKGVLCGSQTTGIEIIKIAETLLP